MQGCDKPLAFTQLTYQIILTYSDSLRALGVAVSKYLMYLITIFIFSLSTKCIMSAMASSLNTLYM